MRRSFARSIRGLEWVVAAEVERVGGREISLGHREVHFLGGTGDLRTADDAFETVAEIDGIDHTRGSLRTLAEAELKLPEDVGGQRARFEIVASFLGRRNYNRYDIEDALGAAVMRATGWEYLSRREGAVEGADVTVRAHLRDGTALVGVRSARPPLHRRSYKLESGPGSLHPPVAAAMSMLAGTGLVVDPACGDGTIPIEAVLLGATAVGSDLDGTRVAQAVGNASRAGARCSFLRADGARLPFRRADAVASNLPWERTVGTVGAREAIIGQVARLLERSGRAVLVLADPGDVSPLEVVLRAPLSLFGAHPELLVLRPRGGTFELAEDLQAWWDRRLR